MKKASFPINIDGRGSIRVLLAGGEAVRIELFYQSTIPRSTIDVDLIIRHWVRENWWGEDSGKIAAQIQSLVKKHELFGNPSSEQEVEIVYICKFTSYSRCRSISLMTITKYDCIFTIVVILVPSVSRAAEALRMLVVLR